MKFLFLTLSLITSTVCVSAQDVRLVPKLAAEYTFHGDYGQAVEGRPGTRIAELDPADRIMWLGNVRTRIGLDVRYHSFTLSFDNETFIYAKGVKVNPVHTNYTAQLGYSFTAYDQKLRAYIKHVCMHPTKTGDTPVKFQGYYGGYTAIGFEINY